MKNGGEVEAWLLQILSSAVVGGVQFNSPSGRFIPRDRTQVTTEL